MPKKSKLILPQRLLVALSGFSIAMWFGAYFHWQENRGGNNWMLILATLFSLISLISLWVDLYRNSNNRSKIWLYFSLLMPILVPFLYFLKTRKTPL